MFRFLADAVVLLHFGFLAFVAVGGLVAWRWPRVLWLHVPAVAWGLGSVTVGADCPLTSIEKHLLHLGGRDGYDGGFVDRYVEDVIYPQDHTPLVRTVAVALIVAGWTRVLANRRSERAPAAPSRPSRVDGVR